MRTWFAVLLKPLTISHHLGNRSFCSRSISPLYHFIHGSSRKLTTRKRYCFIDSKISPQFCWHSSHPTNPHCLKASPLRGGRDRFCLHAELKRDDIGKICCQDVSLTRHHSCPFAPPLLSLLISFLHSKVTQFSDLSGSSLLILKKHFLCKRGEIDFQKEQ